MADEEKALPLIEFTKTKCGMESYEQTSITVRGSTLEECRKHFEEIMSSRGG